MSGLFPNAVPSSTRPGGSSAANWGGGLAPWSSGKGLTSRAAAALNEQLTFQPFGSTAGYADFKAAATKGVGYSTWIPGEYDKSGTLVPATGTVSLNHLGKMVNVAPGSGLRIVDNEYHTAMVAEKVQQAEEVRKLVQYFLMAGDEALYHCSPSLYSDCANGDKGVPGAPCLPSVIQLFPPSTMGWTTGLWRLEKLIQRHIDTFVWANGDPPDFTSPDKKPLELNPLTVDTPPPAPQPI